MDKHLERLEHLKTQWLAMIDAIDDPLVVVDKDYRIIRFNKAYFQTLQAYHKTPLPAAHAHIQHKKCYEIFAEQNAPCAHCQLKKEKTDAQWEAHALFEGHVFEIRTHALGKDQGFVVHYRDITHIKELEQHLAHADKLASVGKLASGVAHEINSPLAGILAFAQILLSEIQEPHFREDLEHIQNAARKCKTIVENLLKMSRYQRVDAPMARFSLRDEIQNVVDFTLPLAQKNKVKVHCTLSPQDPLEMLGNQGEVGQIFLNLIHNAIAAMPAGGDLFVRADKDETGLFAEVEDTGCGIAKDILPKIFDPFFTTKPIGEGTGLGLSVTYSLVKHHQGSIEVTSQEGQGALFRVRFAF